MLETLFGKKDPATKSSAPFAAYQSPAAVAEPVSAAITPVSIDRDVLAQHAALSAKLGIHSTADQELQREAFEAFLSECGFRIYDEKQVGAYLTGQYGEASKDNDGNAIPAWGWRPARAPQPANTSTFVSSGETFWISGAAPSWMFSGSGGGAWGPNGAIQHHAHNYLKPIPIPVLLTIERVVDKFPNVGLYVSDEFHPREFVKDPFLMVVYLERRYIIERWDEPNYKER